MTKQQRHRLAVIASCAMLWPYDRPDDEATSFSKREDALRKWRGQDEVGEDDDGTKRKVVSRN
jgi:hypothetical protein